MSSLFRKVAVCKTVTLFKMKSFKGIFKDFSNIKNYFFLCFYSLETASYMVTYYCLLPLPDGYKINEEL